MRQDPIFARTTQVELAKRTRWLTHLLLEPLVAVGKSGKEAEEVVNSFVIEHMSKLDDKGEKTAALIYLSAADVQEMTTVLLENWKEILSTLQPAAGKSIKKSPVLAQLSKDLIKRTKNGTSAPDIALFGRMLAFQPELNLEAACQVAHAISTHRVIMEMDYFTAVDDLNSEGETGAGMIGFVGFNSACFYRYARLDWPQLLKNLRGEVGLTRRTAEAFVRATIAAIPKGKQNSTAAHNPPSFILAVVREDGMGWSLVNAFENPIRAKSGTGLVAPSVAALDTYWGRLTDVYGTRSIRAVLALSLDPDLPLNRLAGQRVENLDALIEGVLAALPGQEAHA
jgi:CRISPR system Cascade subunit CasC